MSAVGTAAAGVGIAGVIDRVLQNVLAKDFDMTSSLSRYTRDTTLINPIFIDSRLIDDEVIVPLLQVFSQMYAGYIFSYFAMSQCIVGGRTVRDAVKDVRTVQSMLESNHIPFNTLATEDDRPGGGKPSGGNRITNLEDAGKNLVAPRVINVEIQTPGGVDADGNPVPTSKATIQFLVHLPTMFMVPEVIDGFLDITFEPPFSLRKRQAQTGEIRFLSDLLLARDLIARRIKAMKADRTGLLASLLSQRSNRLFHKMKSLITMTPANRNLANHTFIVDKRTFDRACHNSGVDFENPVHRDKFMDRSFMIFVASVDPMYSTVDVYINGIAQKGTYTYPMVKSVGGKDSDKLSLKDVLTVFSQGQVPKF